MTVELTGKSSEIPLPTDKLLLIDLDKTLIDPNYQITDQNIFEEIKRVQSLGWQIGLSSDTPLEIMQNWKKEFGMNGPIIAERGALIQLVNGTEIELIENSREYFVNLRRKLVSQISDRNIPLYIGDAVSFLRNKTKLIGSTDKSLVLINAYRRCSLGFWVRSVDNSGELNMDNSLVEELLQNFEPVLSNAPFELERDLNKDYGIFIVSPREVNKRVATQRLMNKLHLVKIGMVGDSKTDIVGSDIAVHYAVGNARAELLSISDYKSTKDYTEGVVDILSKIK
jgi:hydroxymethylpyrimidine pyrophosphatase-like HAD family hydrolase